MFVFLASIKAVLNPINSNYLYFVATGKGDHHFSASIEFPEIKRDPVEPLREIKEVFSLAKPR